jgi:hypothetical protein
MTACSLFICFRLTVNAICLLQVQYPGDCSVSDIYPCQKPTFMEFHCFLWNFARSREWHNRWIPATKNGKCSTKLPPQTLAQRPVQYVIPVQRMPCSDEPVAKVCGNGQTNVPPSNVPTTTTNTAGAQQCSCAVRRGGYAAQLPRTGCCQSLCAPLGAMF